MGALNYVEYALSTIFANAKGRDAKLFITRPAFAQLLTPAISVTSPDVGPSNSVLGLAHTQLGTNQFPELSWDAVPGAQEYLIVCEDADAPLPTPALHGVFYGIPSTKTSVTNADFETVKTKDGAKNVLKGGFKHGANLRGTKYGGARPLLGHGVHRYFYMIVALKEPLDTKGMSMLPKREEIAKEIDGKVLGWGTWIGTYERKWE